MKAKLFKENLNKSRPCIKSQRTCCVVGQLSLNTMTRMLTLGEGFGYLFSAVKEAKVVDEYTVEFVLQYR